MNKKGMVFVFGGSYSEVGISSATAKGDDGNQNFLHFQHHYHYHDLEDSACLHYKVPVLAGRHSNLGSISIIELEDGLLDPTSGSEEVIG